MKKTIWIIATLGILVSAQARTWTSKDGKKIEATFIALQGETLTIKKRGKVYKLPLDKLSEADQTYAREQAEKLAEDGGAADELSLMGKKLTPGEPAVIEFELNDKTRKALSKNKLKPSKGKISILLPKGFDPQKPQKVFWPVGGINNEQERLGGNLGRFGPMKEQPSKRGWIVIAADTEHGNPRETTIAAVKGDFEFHQQLVDEISKQWPGFKDWKHACGGFSSGAKASFFRTAQLLKSDVNVVGMFLTGCNGAYADAASDETRVKKSGTRKVRVWLSHGTKDNLVNDTYTSRVLDGLKKGGYREVRSESYEGGHTLNQEEFGKALDWFTP